MLINAYIFLLGLKLIQNLEANLELKSKQFKI